MPDEPSKETTPPGDAAKTEETAAKDEVLAASPLVADETPVAASDETPAAASGEAPESEAGAPQPEPEPTFDLTGFAGKAVNGYVWGTGRRKSSVARVRIRPGEGKFEINKRPVEEFFHVDRYHEAILSPLKVTKTAETVDVFVRVHGGGTTGQAGAILLGLARALKTFDPTCEPALREHNLLTRDARKVERKKYGQRGARRRFQFSKR